MIPLLLLACEVSRVYWFCAFVENARENEYEVDMSTPRFYIFQSSNLMLRSLNEYYAVDVARLHSYLLFVSFFIEYKNVLGHPAQKVPLHSVSACFCPLIANI